MEDFRPSAPRNDIDELLQSLNEVVELERNRKVLKVLDTDFSRMGGFLIDIRNQFQSRQKKPPDPVERCLGRINDALVKAKRFMKKGASPEPEPEPEPEPGWYPRCCDLFSHSDLSSRARIWKARFDVLLQVLEMVFSTSANTEQSLYCRLLQPAPEESGFVGSGIQSARNRLQKWLTEPGREARVIGVYGPGGVGKTSLLKIIYNAYKKEVSRFFDVVIWFAVSGIFENEQLQASIAEALNLSLEGTSNVETRKSNLNASLQRKKFLLILDNVQSEIKLDELGVKIGDDYGSKLLISSRDKEVIRGMGANDQHCLQVQPLSLNEEDWELFRTGAFADGAVPEPNIEGIARKMASRCKGLPLTINAVASAMKLKNAPPEEWSRALTSMEKTDCRTIEADSSINRGSIDVELYRLLRWCYNQLPHTHLKDCFLICAAFLEDKEIPVETLVKMWDAEGLLDWTGEPNLMDAGRHCIDELVKRRLVECVEHIVDDDYHSVQYLKIHEVLFDMAIHIGKMEEKCLFAASQQLKEIPNERGIGDCKRISVSHNAIRKLPEDLKSKELQSLVLASNMSLEEIPKEFSSNVTSLRALDLSCTSIATLPTSMGKLQQLEFLNLSRCSKIVELPDEIWKLQQLKHLDLSCTSITNLSIKIGELKKLKHLKLDACYSLTGIPSNLSQLTSLNTLILPLMESTCAMSVKDLRSLSNLMELTTVVKAVKAETDVDSTWSSEERWSEMRNLTLEYDAEVSQHVILQNMGNMKNLQSFHLINYQGVSLPDSIREFQKMKMLLLHSCYQLKALFAFEKKKSDGGQEKKSGEIEERSDGQETKSDEIVGDHFPMLEKLVLRNLLKLESIAGDPGLWKEGTMANLQLLVIINCPLLEKLPSEMKLPHLRELHITMCNELMELDIGSGNFPMLEMLKLDELNKLKSIAGGSESIAGVSAGMWNESTLSKLQILEFIDCPLLTTLPRGIEKLSSLKQINGEADWWRRITWEDDKIRISLSRLFLMI